MHIKLLLIVLIIFPTFLLGQARVFRPDNQVYIEANTGIGVSGGRSIIPAFSTKDWKVSNLPFTSLCIGYTSDVGDYSLIDISAGGSFPDIWTAKFGLGSYYDMGGQANASIILGIRLNPGMIYSQYNIKVSDLGFFTFCAEMGTGYWGRGEYIHALNIGWKWPLIGWDKKEKK